MSKLLLASSSPFRKELMQRLGLAFATASPEIDEAARPEENAESLVLRLSEAKSQALARQYPGYLIIGSDQVATLDGRILTKPGNHENALAQLRQSSGKQVKFNTGLCLLNTDTGNVQLDVVPFTVTFRQLTDQQIENYLQREQPYNCAGSFKSEGLGISLFEKMQGDDPTALIGLPLIRLTQMLQNEGVDVLGN